MNNTATVSEPPDANERVQALIRWHEDAEEATVNARTKSEKARDFYDNKQWTAEEVAALEKRGQPVVTINRIKRKVSFLVGFEKQNRTGPRAFPRTPAHEAAAQAATDAIKFVCNNNNFDSVRSQVWEELLIEGMSGAEVTAKPVTDGANGTESIEITIAINHFDRTFYDPHAREADFSDARFTGTVIWMDLDEALQKWPDAQEQLEGSLRAAATGDTWGDRPHQTLWGDGKTKRIRVVQMYYRWKGEGGMEWRWSIFSRGGEIRGGVSPYLDERGKPENPMKLTSAFVDRDNNRYGMVEELISPQEEINKRRSKALHLLNTRQVRTTDTELDQRKLRDELAKPDGVIIQAPGTEFELLNTGDMAEGQVLLLQEAKNEIDGMGPNAALDGKLAQNESGRAILARQQGGATELGGLTDRLRQWNFAIYRTVWNRIRQFWKEERWIRVTDNEDNLKFIGLNTRVTLGDAFAEDLRARGASPEQVAAAQSDIANDPRAQELFRVENSVADIDVDIVVSESFNSAVIEQEQFAELVNLAQAGVTFPPEVYIRASQLRNKDELLGFLKAGPTTPEEAAEMDALKQLGLRKAVADVEKTESEAAGNRALAAKATAELDGAPTAVPAAAAPQVPAGAAS